MGQIREELILGDLFSDILERFTRKMGGAAQAATVSYEAISAAQSNAAERAAQYQSMLQRTDNEYYKLSVQSETQARQLRAMEQAGDAGTDAYRRLSASLERTAQKSEYLTIQHDVLDKKIQDLSETATRAAEKQKEMADAAEMAAGAEDDLAEAASNAADSADGGAKSTGHFDETSQQASKAVDHLVGSLKRAAMAYLSVKKALDTVSKAMSENTYELRFSAIMGEEVGASAAEFGRWTANQYGRNVEDVFKQISGLSRLGATGQNTADLAELTNRLAWFGDSNDYSSMANAIDMAFRTGNLRTISSQTRLTNNTMESLGVKKAIDAGDLDGFIAALGRAADAAGLTQEALEKITQGPQAKWNRFISSIKNSSVQAASAFLDAFAPAFDKLDAWTESEQGSKFFAGLSAAMGLAGTVASGLVNVLMMLGGFLSDNFTTVMTVAGVAASLFAVKMLAVAISGVIANAPLLLGIAIIAALFMGLQQLGVGAEEVFGVIGTTAGILYAALYNIVANIWNAIAAFAEFFANVFDDPVAAVAHLFFDVFDSILGIVETAAGAIDTLLGTDMSGAVSGFRSKLKDWVNDTFGENAEKIERMAELDVTTTAEDWSGIGAGLGEKMDDFSEGLDKFEPNLDVFNQYSGLDGISDLLGNIDKNTGQTAKNTADLADEDFKYLEDVAIRRYEAHINSTSLVPQITVQVDGRADRETAEDIAGRIAAILRREAASATSLTFAEV